MNEPNLTQVLHSGFLSLEAQIHTALPARVLKFNASDNTVQIELMVNELKRDGVSVVLPPLDDVPVQFFRGGDFVITTPIKAGDFGLCVFAERCIDGWFASASKSEPLDFRLHDYSDGFFLTGFSPRPAAVKNVDLDGVCMRTLDKGTYIKLTNGKILIKGDIEQIGDYIQTGNKTLKGNFTQAEGDSISSGTITAKDMIASGVSLKKHTHGGDSGGTTTPPN
jgi:hypothetical protein